MTLWSVASAEKCLHSISFWWCLLQKRYQNSNLALGGTPAQTRAQARDSCVLSRCSSESEYELWYLFYIFWRCDVLLKFKYQWWHFKFPFSGERLCHILSICQNQHVRTVSRTLSSALQQFYYPNLITNSIIYISTLCYLNLITNSIIYILPAFSRTLSSSTNLLSKSHDQLEGGSRFFTFSGFVQVFFWNPLIFNETRPETQRFGGFGFLRWGRHPYEVEVVD